MMKLVEPFCGLQCSIVCQASADTFDMFHVTHM